MSVTFEKYSSVDPPCPPIVEGAVISYAIVINNTSGQTLKDVLFIDTMALGLAYISNSLVINGVVVPTAVPSHGVYLGDIPNMMKYQLNYEALIVNPIGNYISISVLTYSNGGPDVAFIQTC